MPRPKGSPNKITAEVRGMIRHAFIELGGKDWLVKQAELQPVAFMQLLGKLVPSEIVASVDGLTQRVIVIKDFTGRSPGIIEEKPVEEPITIDVPVGSSEH